MLRKLFILFLTVAGFSDVDVFGDIRDPNAIRMSMLIEEANSIYAAKVIKTTPGGLESIAVTFNEGSNWQNIEARILLVRCRVLQTLKGLTNSDITIKCHQHDLPWVKLPGINEGFYLLFLKTNSHVFTPFFEQSFFVPLSEDAFKKSHSSMEDMLIKSIALGDPKKIMLQINALSQIMTNESFKQYLAVLSKVSNDRLRGLAIYQLLKMNDANSISNALQYVSMNREDRFCKYMCNEIKDWLSIHANEKEKPVFRRQKR